ncbi:MAG TPA: acylneuraminate cytidylyltransferase family protein [Gaiellaceae bacterium]|nr:acylneuraminate cytidylyltransferase family protein [Gaiellaceae bacterium]
MRTLAVIPARGGSERVPRKNLALLEGRTLVRRALETAGASPFDCVALSSDDDEILAEAEGLEVVAVPRPSSLGTATTRTFDVVQHALGTLERPGRFDAVAVIQATSPFTLPGDLAGALALLEETGAASVVSVSRLEPGRHPLKLKRLDADWRLTPYLAEDGLTPSHELPPLWVRNGSIYLSRRFVLDGGRLIDENDVRGYEMPTERSFDIDTPRDLAFARFLVERGDNSE